MASTSSTAGADLYWLPLGAGGRSVCLNGKVFEAVAPRLDRRHRCDLYHSALEVRVPDGRFIIEQAPVWTEDTERVVAEGPVGARALGRRFRLFRYEVRRWRDGVIPDVAEAVASPLRLSDDPDRARRILELVAQVPTPVWGRDELGAGEMWNSNSTISWVLACSGLDVGSIPLPPGGRALAGEPASSSRSASDAGSLSGPLSRRCKPRMPSPASSRWPAENPHPHACRHRWPICVSAQCWYRKEES